LTPPEVTVAHVTVTVVLPPEDTLQDAIDVTLVPAACSVTSTVQVLPSPSETLEMYFVALQAANRMAVLPAVSVTEATAVVVV